jgi:hypothetical protein
MNLFYKILKRFLFISTAIMAGISIFAALAVFNTNKTILNSNFHKELFTKNDIYTKTQSVLNNSMAGFISDLKKSSPDNFNQYNKVLLILEKSLTPEMIKYNLDSVREGLFQYFSGERRFLPDIYLSEQAQINADKKIIEEKDESPANALTKIDKINLSAILLYINRSDISDFLFITKSFYFITQTIPGFSLLLFLLFSLIGLIVCVKPIHVIKWIIVTLSTCCLFSLILGLTIIIFNNYIIPSNIYQLTMSIPLQSEVILAYIHDSIMPISTSLLVTSIFLFILTFIIFNLPNFFKTLFSKQIDDNAKKSQRFLKNSVYIIVCFLAVSSIVYKYDITKKSFDDNDLGVALSKLKNVNTVTEVIPAKKEAIYGLNIKLVDAKTKTPIADTQINISGKSSLLKKDFNNISATDSSGIAKFKLDKGTFRISFLQHNFPTGYQLPSPFFFDLKSAGTTIITINLQTMPDDAKEKWGIAEIELLDKDNLPVPNIELSAQTPVYAPGFPDNIHSFTNSEGIAVFKLNEGNYNVNFVETKFPLTYKLPPSVEISISYNILNRYTIRLVDSK